MRLFRLLLIAVVFVAGSDILLHAEIAGPAVSSTTQCCDPEDEPTDCTTGATCCNVSGQSAALLTPRSMSDLRGSFAKRSFHSLGVNAATSWAG